MVINNTENMINITNEDNMQLMARYPDNYFDLAIVDPPYGINAEQGTNKASRKQFADKKYGWDSKPPESKYYKELFRVSKNQIIWGANHFIEDLPNANSKSWLIWDKKNPDRCFADAEMAWCSQIDNVRIIDIKRVQELNRADGGKIHPTQKPTQLYSWIINRYTKPNFKILDTHIGSGSIAIAVDNANKIDKMNLTLIGCELDPDYYKATMKRIKEQTNWQSLF
jgi:site-specific DNA-methyltransferase (adenine-specific)